MKKISIAMITLFILFSSVAYADYASEKKEYTDRIAQETRAIEWYKTEFLTFITYGIIKYDNTPEMRAQYQKAYEICMEFIQDSEDIITLYQGKLAELEKNNK
jgi:hypothetical protein